MIATVVPVITDIALPPKTENSTVVFIGKALNYLQAILSCMRILRMWWHVPVTHEMRQLLMAPVWSGADHIQCT